MKYTSDFGLSSLINQHRKRMLNNVLFGLFVVLFSLIIMYYLGGERIDFKNLLGVSIFLVTIGFMQYSQVVPNGLIVNNTVLQVILEPDRILVETSPFKVFFWINKPSKQVIFSRSELKVKMVAYPVKSIFDLGNRVIRLTDNEKEVFIIVDYFDGVLKEKLMELAT